MPEAWLKRDLLYGRRRVPGNGIVASPRKDNAQGPQLSPKKRAKLNQASFLLHSESQPLTLQTVRVALDGHSRPSSAVTATDLIACGKYMVMGVTRPNSPGKSEQEDDGPNIDWQAVLTEHNPWLRKVVGIRVRDAQAIDEVMQEVALAAVTRKDALADRANLGPWLYRLAVIQSLLYRRKRGRRQRLADRYARWCRPNEHDTRQIDPLAWLLAQEHQTQIRVAMARLPTREAEILLLKYTENWSYRELAEHLGISEIAVDSRLRRARKRLQAELTSLCVIEVKR